MLLLSLYKGGACRSLDKGGPLARLIALSVTFTDLKMSQLSHIFVLYVLIHAHQSLGGRLHPNNQEVNMVCHML